MVTGPSRIALRFAGVLPALVLLAAFSTVVLSAPSAVPEQEHALSGESLAAALKRGGYALVARLLPRDWMSLISGHGPQGPNILRRFGFIAAATIAATRNIANQINAHSAIERPRKRHNTLVQSPLPRKIMGSASASGKDSIM